MAATAESAGRGGPPITAETIVLTVGRPVLDIKGGATVVEISEVESQVWKGRLNGAVGKIKPNIPAVGRIELLNFGVDWLGTGWLIRDNIIVTNRHVAVVFGRHNGDEFVFRTGLDETPIQAKIDFLEEFDGMTSHEFPLFKIVHIEDDSGPDLAFLRIEPVAGQSLPAPVVASSKAAVEGDQVAVIGYPARDPFFPEPDVMDRIFSHRYDKKRLAPGLITGRRNGRVFHDCSTLGGNSGGEVISLATGNAVALHFAGTLFTTNHAVPIDVVSERLDKVLAGQIRPTTPRPARRPEQLDRPISPVPSVTSSRVIEAVIPIKVRVEVGDITVGGATSVKVATPIVPRKVDDESGDDLIEIVEARPEDYRNRKGYVVNFLGNAFKVPLPVMTEHKNDILTFSFDGSTLKLLQYQHFSVLMSKSRRMCRFSACNIDGKLSKRSTRAGWQYDPRIPQDKQIMKECYGNEPKFSRGHMTRREDPAWGDQFDRGNRDSMHVTNAVPQIQPFNAGVWLDLEDYALQNAREDDKKISVFTGPFLSNNDPVRYGVKVPITFWKVIAFIHDETGKLCATGYTMSQRSFIGEEEFIFGRHENNQRPIGEIERRAGISFGPLAALDPLRDQPESVMSPLTHVSQIRFR